MDARIHSGANEQALAPAHDHEKAGPVRMIISIAAKLSLDSVMLFGCNLGAIGETTVKQTDRKSCLGEGSQD